MRMAIWAAMTAALATPLAAEILDRTVAIVGAESILVSEIDSQLRLEAMFSDRPVDTSPEARAQALERLIDQRLLAAQIALSGIETAEEEELDRQARELTQQTFGGLPFDQALERYEISREVALEFQRRQLRFADYINFRFRSGLEASEESVRAEYRLRFGDRENAPPLEEVEDELAETVRIQAAETALEDRIRRLRASTRIVRLPLLEADRQP